MYPIAQIKHADAFGNVRVLNVTATDGGLLHYSNATNDGTPYGNPVPRECMPVSWEQATSPSNLAARLAVHLHSAEILWSRKEWPSCFTTI